MARLVGFQGETGVNQVGLSDEQVNLDQRLMLMLLWMVSFSLLSPTKPPCISSCFTYLVLCACSIKLWEGHGERDCHFTLEDTRDQLHIACYT